MSGLTTRDLLRELLRDTGSSASVYLAAASSEAGDTSEQLALRRRAIVGRLSQQRADDLTVDAVDRQHASLPSYQSELGLIAASGLVRVFSKLPGGVPQDRARFGTPAMLGPLLRWIQNHPPHLVVVADRTGADISVVPASAQEPRTRTVTGPDDEIERNAPGGWSQPRYQRRAVDSWQHNAGAVAEAIEEELATIRARLVLLAGDIRACQLLSERLSRLGVPPVIRNVPGVRNQDSSPASHQSAMEAAVQAYAEELEHATKDRFSASRGPNGTVINGSRAVLAALAAGRVGSLLVVDDPADDRPGWFDAEGWCSASRSDPRPPGAHRGRLVDVAIRSALLTDAEVCVLRPDDEFPVSDGLAALGRY
jgi:hypothetical protein